MLSAEKVLFRGRSLDAGPGVPYFGRESVAWCKFAAKQQSRRSVDPEGSAPIMHMPVDAAICARQGDMPSSQRFDKKSRGP